MIIIEPREGTATELLELANQFPGLVTKASNRAIDGSATGITILISAAALAIPEIRKVAIEIIRARASRSITYKGVKLQGYSAEEAEKIVSQLSTERKQQS